MHGSHRLAHGLGMKLWIQLRHGLTGQKIHDRKDTPKTDYLHKRSE